VSANELLALWQEAGRAYGVPWEILASIMRIESNFGANMGPSSAGAVGWMQFLPSTWTDWGVDANGDGIADPWNATDAVYAAARYLVATGAHDDLPGALWSYNHSWDYVAAVLEGARDFATDPLAASLGGYGTAGSGLSLDQLEQQLAETKDRVEALTAHEQALEDELEQGTWSLQRVRQRAGDPSLSDAAFAEAQAAVLRETQAHEARRAELDQVRGELEQARAAVLGLEQDIAIASSQTGPGLFDKFLPPAPTEAAKRVIDYALSHFGVPYQWGGNHGVSLEGMILGEPVIANGFDCSSLLSWSFAKGAGIYIGDYTGTQWGSPAAGAIRGFGPAVGGTEPPGGFLPGDLIFFNDTDHVALYLGNDLFVHAPHTGDVVRVARLSSYGPVWGWVRYQQLSGIAPAAPDDGRVFTVVAA
jgi:cell wall-associated NlpC family hydrolase